MKDNCQCDKCKNLVNEYFCMSCGHNYNECESFFQFMEAVPKNPSVSLSSPLPSFGVILCPKCHPESGEFQHSFDDGSYIIKK